MVLRTPQKLFEVGDRPCFSCRRVDEEWTAVGLFTQEGITGPLRDLAEAGYGDLEGTQLRWRKTYVPGPTGLDDAAQVVVEVVDVPVGAVQGTRLYTYLRDELGTVLGLVAEEEGTDSDRDPG